MHFTPQLFAFAAAALPFVNANFDVYRVDWRSALGKNAVGWQFFAAQPSCDEAIHSPIWTDSSNVSGNSLGVRCKGSGCSSQTPPENIEQLEIHVANNPLYHWSKSCFKMNFEDAGTEMLMSVFVAIYSDRGRSMVGCK